ncbi:MAG: WD40 repeat domain-containing protein [Planctomycetota bacterium]|nr:WD40 repeat domain-containing protein [Planctomycetota bacterium]
MPPPDKDNQFDDRNRIPSPECELVDKLKPMSSQTRDVAWSPDGSKLAGCGEHRVEVWDDTTGDHLGPLGDDVSGTLHSVAWSPDGARVASCSDDGTVMVWDAGELLTFTGHEDRVRDVAWSPDGTRLASGSDDSTVRLWDVASSGSQHVTRNHDGPVYAVAWNPDGTMFASGGWFGSGLPNPTSTGKYAQVEVWEVVSGKIVHVITEHDSGATAVAWSPDGGRFASGCDDGTVKVWDTESYAEIHTLKGHEGAVWSIAWSPDGTRLVSGSRDEPIPLYGSCRDRTVKVWDAVNGSELYTLKDQKRILHAVDWSPDGVRIATCGLSINIWAIPK